MEFLRFIFSSFWVWLGFTILVCVVGGGVIEMVKACKPGKRRVETYRDADRLKVTVIGASKEESKAAHDAVITAIYDGYGYKLAENENNNEEVSNNGYGE